MRMKNSPIIPFYVLNETWLDESDLNARQTKNWPVAPFTNMV